jgi:hypothetical protein
MFYNEEYYTNCSGVKNRKKKKKVKEQDDIVSLNLKIVNKFNEIKENLFKRKDDILQVISTTDIPYGVKQDEIYNILSTFNPLLKSQTREQEANGWGEPIDRKKGPSSLGMADAHTYIYYQQFLYWGS